MRPFGLRRVPFSAVPCRDRRVRSLLWQGCQQAPCNVNKYTFSSQAWSTCSVSCGTGVQTRRVFCALSTVPDVPVANAFCDGLDPGTTPPSQQNCMQGPCAVYSYGFRAWGACSITCGTGGVQTRATYCQAASGAAVANSFCESVGAAPPSTQPCSGAQQSCSEYSFSFGRWNACSATCGPGEQTRQVYCTSAGGAAVADNFCLGTKATQPPSSQTCMLRPCVAFSWATPDWSPCDVTCGAGVRSRDVHCLGSDGNRYGDAFCSKSSAQVVKPATTMACVTTTPCLAYGYAVSYWCTRDTTPCFEDTKSYDRTITCVDSSGNAVRRELCAGEEPATKLSCDMNTVVDDYIRQVCLSAVTDAPIGSGFSQGGASAFTFGPTAGKPVPAPLPPLPPNVGGQISVVQLTLKGDVSTFGAVEKGNLIQALSTKLNVRECDTALRPAALIAVLFCSRDSGPDRPNRSADCAGRAGRCGPDQPERVRWASPRGHDLGVCNDSRHN